MYHIISLKEDGCPRYQAIMKIIESKMKELEPSQHFLIISPWKSSLTIDTKISIQSI